MAYEMLTGRNPFQAVTIREVFALVFTAIRRPWEWVATSSWWCAEGWPSSNRERFPAITAFSEVLRAAAAGRLRDSQRAATLAYAAGELRQPRISVKSSWGTAGARHGAHPVRGGEHDRRLCRRQ